MEYIIKALKLVAQILKMDNKNGEYGWFTWIINILEGK